MNLDASATQGTGRGLARRDWRKVLLAGALAALATVTLFSLEELAWRLLGRPAEADVLVVTIVACAFAAGAIAIALKTFAPAFPALAVALCPAGVLVVHALVRDLQGHSVAVRALLEPKHYPAVVSALFGLVFALGMAWLATRPHVLRVLVFSSLALLPVAARWPVRSHVSAIASAAGHPDIILLVMDTTRRDHLSVYGYALPTSPSLERLGAESAVYDDAWSVAPWTPPSHASIFTGRLPAEHGVDGQDPSPFPPDLPTLQGVLWKGGYRTAGFVANPNLTARGWDRDFDEYRPPWYVGSHSLIVHLNAWFLGFDDPWDALGGGSHRLIDLACRWWASEAGRPRFLFINLMDPHRPYRPPLQYGQRFLGDIPREEAEAVEENPDPYILGRRLTERDRRSLNALYDGEVASMDQEIGRFVSWLRERGDLERTILVITADHGERLGERGLVGHDGPAEQSMDQYLLHVPLLVRYPPAVTPGRVPSRVQLDGLAGHVLRLAGLDVPEVLEPRPWRTTSTEVPVAQFQSPTWIVDRLLAIKPGLDTSRLLRDWAFATDGHWACSCPAGGPTGACFVVDLTADRDWTHNLVQAMPEGTARLCEVALSLPRFGAVTPYRANPDLLKHLRSLGYVQ
jgi:arylsulfatase A-like enzyme